jgi:hypothetical protein
MKEINRLLYILSISIFTIGMVSCCSTKKTTATTDTTKQQAPDYAKEGYVKATVIHLELDGCNFLLKLDSGKRLEAIGLPEELKQENMQVWIKYVPNKDVMSTCMAGDIVKLTDYKIAK